MTVQRAVVKGLLFGVVQVRNMFTCDVVPQGGDTAEILWNAYLDSIYVSAVSIMVGGATFQSYEIQQPNGDRWEVIDEVEFTYDGGGSGDYLPNAVALVLLGKAAGIRHVGRKFFSGLSEGVCTGNALATAGLAAATSALLAYITPFTGLGGGTITPGVRSQNGGFHPFVGGVISSILGSMRRRKPGLGI